MSEGLSARSAAAGTVSSMAEVNAAADRQWSAMSDSMPVMTLGQVLLS